MIIFRCILANTKLNFYLTRIPEWKSLETSTDDGIHKAAQVQVIFKEQGSR
jgi:hypothetical protein